VGENKPLLFFKSPLGQDLKGLTIKPGAWNIPEHQKKYIIIMRKIYKI